jgi:hypothetical protein
MHSNALTSNSGLSTIYQNHPNANLFSHGTNDGNMSGFQLVNPSQNCTFENEGSSFNNTKINVNTKRPD